MCDYQPQTVRLYDNGRSFACPYCQQVREHPHFDYYAARDGYAYCGVCGKWMKIENYVTFKTEEESIAARKGVRCVKTK